MSDERDYIAEMDARIRAATTGAGPWVPTIVAQKLHAELLESDADLLDGWLHAVAADVIRQAITLRVRLRNGAARRGARAREFAAAARDLEDAADEAARGAAGARLVSLFESLHTVDEKNTHKRACDMTGPEHLFVARNQYEAKAKPLMMLAAFHKAVAKKVGQRLTSDVFTEEQYEAMYLSIARKAA